VVPCRVTGGSRQIRHCLAAGTLESGFRHQTCEWAARLERARIACAYQEWAGGHDNWWWHSQLPEALAWLLTAK
jgi:enterochelin esterase-like enzyme